MVNMETMRLIKAIWIMTFISSMILCVYYLHVTPDQRTGLLRKDDFEKSTDGETKTMILNRHLEQFLDGIPDETSHVERGKDKFDPTLNEKELETIAYCTDRGNTDLDIGYNELLNNKHVCVNHHVYLKENDSILIEVGGNAGADASLFTAMYNPRHIIVEPLPIYTDVLKDKFKDNSRVTVLNFGLGKKTGTTFMEMNGEASNSVHTKDANTMVKAVNSTEFFQNIGVGKFSVDLLTMDCEGCELDVLENLLESGMVKYFKNIQFEYHGMYTFVDVEDYLKRYCTLQEYMQRTHRLTYQYKRMWENWRLLDLK